MKDKITSEQLAEIERARKANRYKNVEKRLRVLVLCAKETPIAEIMTITGSSRSNIYRILTIYREQGLSALVKITIVAIGGT